VPHSGAVSACPSTDRSPRSTAVATRSCRGALGRPGRGQRRGTGGSPAARLVHDGLADHRRDARTGRGRGLIDRRAGHSGTARIVGSPQECGCGVGVATTHGRFPSSRGVPRRRPGTVLSHRHRPVREGAIPTGQERLSGLCCAGPCLGWALRSGQQEGVWGGLDPDERRVLRERKPRRATVPDQPLREGLAAQTPNGLRAR
jgi:hypothetical protein